MPIYHSETEIADDRKPTLPVRTSVADPLCEIVDMTMLLSFEEVQVEGEPDLIVELIDIYLEEALHQMSAIQQAIANTDAPALKRATHSLKGSSANLGAYHMAAFCEDLEQIAGNNLFHSAGALLIRLRQEFEQVRQALLAERQRRL